MTNYQDNIDKTLVSEKNSTPSTAQVPSSTPTSVPAPSTHTSTPASQSSPASSSHIPSFTFPVMMYAVSALVIFFILLSGPEAFSQTKDVSSMLTTAHSTIRNICVPLVNIVSIILGVIGIVMLIPTFIRYLRRDPTSSEAFIQHGGGYLIAVLLLQLFRTIAF